MTTPTQSKMAPTFINSEKESDPFLKKTKEQLEKKWSVTTMDSLFKITDLAYFLVALGRVDEAKEIGSFLAKTSPFTGNFNLWTPVGHAILLHSHLLRMEGKETEARNFLKPVLENPVSKPLPQEYAEQKLAKIHASIELARKDKVKKASCQEMARNIGSSAESVGGPMGRPSGIGRPSRPAHRESGV